MIGFDPLYFLIIAPGVLLALYAQWKVKSSYHAASEIPASSGATGAETAAVILRKNGISNVGIEETPGELSDHYDPSAKMLRLSPNVYHGRSLAALGIAAHEVGHAIQDSTRYPLMVLRSGIVPLASIGGSLSMFVLMAGALMSSMQLILAGVALFSLTVIFQLVNLPVEFDASSRAKLALEQVGLVRPDEAPVVRGVLSAAAMTYVAATLTGILTLVYYLFRAGLLGGNRESEE